MVPKSPDFASRSQIFILPSDAARKRGHIGFSHCCPLYRHSVYHVHRVNFWVRCASGNVSFVELFWRSFKILYWFPCKKKYPYCHLIDTPGPGGPRMRLNLQYIWISWCRNTYHLTVISETVCGYLGPETVLCFSVFLYFIELHVQKNWAKSCAYWKLSPSTK